jgi:uncharacterized repeat protein (TIGR03803 family)
MFATGTIRHEGKLISSRRAKLVLASILFCFGVSVYLPAQTFTTLAEFNNTDWNPLDPLIQGADGKFYGVTGGNSNFLLGGTDFSYAIGGSPEILYSFCPQNNCATGAEPGAGLIQAPNGKLYGVSSGGGSAKIGTIYSLTTSGTLDLLYQFGTQTNDGINPQSPLTIDVDGNFYGSTYNGGATGYGTIYKISQKGVKTTIYNFCPQTPCVDGAAPYGPMIVGTDGSLYGIAIYGGKSNQGEIFKVTRNGKLTSIYSFCHLANCADGWNAQGGLIQASDGNFYGTAAQGGAHNKGAIFKITPAGTYTVLYSFCDCGDGNTPVTGLVQGTDGNLYGTTEGTTTNYGTLFAITLSGTLTTLHSFNFTDGAGPYGTLLQATDGKFYGTASYGGNASLCQYGCGTLFQLSMGLGPFVTPQLTFGRQGSTAIILGSNLKGASSVSFNGTEAEFKVVSATEITATVPTGATSGTIEVVTPKGTLLSNVPFQVLP